MPVPIVRSLHEHFAALPDPRVDRTKRHDLLDIMTIAVGAVICGADSWADIERFGHAKLPWFRSFLVVPNGVPSHDTVGRVFAALDPSAVAAAFLGWVQALVTGTDGAVVAIDGTTLRCSHDRSRDRAALHLVSAWASTNRVVLGQVATRDHSNELTAIPTLLDALTLEGTLVPIEAMGCQPLIADQIMAGGGDDVLARKANQPTRHELVAHHVALTDAAPDHRTVAKEHGRVESRICRTTDDPAVLAWLDPDRAWPGRRSIAAVTGERRIGETVTTEPR
jgi:predicted transposase YbfD/YdcC